MEAEMERTTDQETSVAVKLIGSFGVDRERIDLRIGNEQPLKEVISLLEKGYIPKIGILGSSYLALINGVESSVLSGLEAKVKPGDELVLLRVSHGG